MRHYYNEFDPQAAAWLRELIRDDLIPEGDVDERDIRDVQPADLRGYRQYHFFAGIGGWPLALRLAGWPDDRPVWTGSCPCQPFSAAGKRKAQADARHLWPDFFRLVRECRPATVFGEQVASSEVVGTELEAAFVVAVQGGEYARANKLAKQLARSKTLHFHPRWIDGVRADMEAEGYAVRFGVLGAHSVGADHIRQRLYWAADAGCVVGERRPGEQRPDVSRAAVGCEEDADDQRRGGTGERVADSDGGPGSTEREQQHGQRADVARGSRPTREQWQCYRCAGLYEPVYAEAWYDDGTAAGVYYCRACRRPNARYHGERVGDPDDAGPQGRGVSGRECSGELSAWSASYLIPCRDGKRRRVPTEPGLFPLAHGVPGRVALLRGAGNAICPQTAAAFVRAYLEARQLLC